MRRTFAARSHESSANCCAGPPPGARPAASAAAGSGTEMRRTGFLRRQQQRHPFVVHRLEIRVGIDRRRQLPRAASGTTMTTSSCTTLAKLVDRERREQLLVGRSCRGRCRRHRGSARTRGSMMNSCRCVFANSAMMSTSSMQATGRGARGFAWRRFLPRRRPAATRPVQSTSVIRSSGMFLLPGDSSLNHQRRGGGGAKPSTDSSQKRFCSRRSQSAVCGTRSRATRT